MQPPSAPTDQLISLEKTVAQEIAATEQTLQGQLAQLEQSEDQVQQLLESAEEQSSDTPDTSMPGGQVEMFVRLRRVVS
jgi:hypothetical protein